jgi:hypothetical protein
LESKYTLWYDHGVTYLVHAICINRAP